jgi:DNA-directed RNA polymerase specialized sigma24 family protein
MTRTDDATDATAPNFDSDLFRRYYAYLGWLARRWLDRAAPFDRAFGADDLTQEIATAVYRGRAYFRPEKARLTTWLARMASRTADAVRRGARARRRVRTAAEVRDEPRAPGRSARRTSGPCSPGS